MNNTLNLTIIRKEQMVVVHLLDMQVHIVHDYVETDCKIREEYYENDCRNGDDAVYYGGITLA